MADQDIIVMPDFFAPPVRIEDLLAGPPAVRCFIGRYGEPEQEIAGATIGDLVANAKAALLGAKT